MTILGKVNAVGDCNCDTRKMGTTIVLVYFVISTFWGFWDFEDKRLNSNAMITKSGIVVAAEYDSISAVEYTIPANGRCMVKAGLAIEALSGVYSRIDSRSGLSVNKSIDVGAGVLKTDYREEVGFVLINQSNTDSVVK